MTPYLQAGLEKGTIQHVPSTEDLLAAQGIDTANLRRRAGALAASIVAVGDENDAAASPRSDASEPRAMLLLQVEEDFPDAESQAGDTAK